MVVFGPRKLLSSYVAVVVFVLVLEHLVEHRAVIFDVVIGARLVSLRQLSLQELAHFLTRQLSVAILVDLLEHVYGVGSVLNLETFHFKVES